MKFEYLLFEPKRMTLSDFECRIKKLSSGRSNDTRFTVEVISRKQLKAAFKGSKLEEQLQDE